MQPDGNAPPMKLDGGWTAENAFMGERAKCFFKMAYWFIKCRTDSG